MVVFARQHIGADPIGTRGRKLDCGWWTNLSSIYKHEEENDK